MINRMRNGRELSHLLFNRSVRPFHLAVTIATGVVCYLTFASADAGWTDQAEIIMGSFAFMATALLAAGWWFRNDWAAEWGLLIAGGVWTARAGLFLLGGEPEASTTVAWYGSLLFSIAWAVGSLGAYALERLDREGFEDEHNASQKKSSDE